MQKKTNNDIIKALTQAKIEADKEKANIKKELLSLEAKRKSGEQPASYVKGKYKNLIIQYGIAATEATALELAKNTLEIEITEKAIEQARKRLQHLKNARKGIKAAASADNVAVIGISNLFNELGERERANTENLKKFAESLIK